MPVIIVSGPGATDPQYTSQSTTEATVYLDEAYKVLAVVPPTEG